MKRANAAESQLPSAGRTWARVFRTATISILCAAYVALGLYFQSVLKVGVIYTHFGYVPIVLAGAWWGRKGVGVALGLTATTWALHALTGLQEPWWYDATRGFFFVTVGLCVGALADAVRKGEQALRISEEKHRLLVEKSLAGILLYRNWRVLFANDRAAKLLGYERQALADKSIWDLICDEDKEMVRKLVAQREAGGPQDLRYECRLVRSDGRLIWADVASSAVNYDGEQAVLVHLYDITERKEAEARRRELAELARKQEEQLVHSTRLAELGEMAAAIAHELKQPLTGIRNFARNAFYMLDTSAGTAEDVKTNLRLISDQVDRAARIINQMRDLTRKSERQFVRLDINAIVRETVEFLSPQFRLSGVEIVLDLAPDLPEVLGDRVRLEQVFLNILTNARQAMAESPVRRLTVQTHFCPENNCPVTIEFSDTGCGFSESVARRLFTPFFSTKRVGHGTGLGLSISLTIVQQHKGRIEARGAPGQGATFTVRLPAAPRRELEEAPETNDAKG